MTIIASLVGMTLFWLSGRAGNDDVRAVALMAGSAFSFAFAFVWWLTHA